LFRLGVVSEESAVAFSLLRIRTSRTPHQGVSTYRDRRRCAGKIRPDEAEAEGCGGSTVKADNEVWPNFSRNPEGRGHFSPALRRSSLRYARYLHPSEQARRGPRYLSLLASRSEQKWLPSPAVPLCRYTLLSRTSDAGCRCHSSASRKLGWEATRVPTNGLGRAGGCEGKMKRPPDGRPSQRLLLRLQTSKFLYSFLLSEYQVGYIVVPTLLRCFGV
jgi:hypothetical protein